MSMSVSGSIIRTDIGAEKLRIYTYVRAWLAAAATTHACARGPRREGASVRQPDRCAGSDYLILGARTLDRCATVCGGPTGTGGSALHSQSGGGRDPARGRLR